MERDGNPQATLATGDQPEVWCAAFVERLRGEWANLTPGTRHLMALEVRRIPEYAAEPGTQAAERWLARPLKKASAC
jgi:hypothetical protein